jgi:hypothetical protein
MKVLSFSDNEELLPAGVFCAGAGVATESAAIATRTAGKYDSMIVFVFIAL